MRDSLPDNDGRSQLVPGHPSNHGATIGVHRSRPPWATVSEPGRGGATVIGGKGIDAWRDAVCKLRLESRKMTDTVRDPAGSRRQLRGLPRVHHPRSDRFVSCHCCPALSSGTIPKDRGKPDGRGVKRGAPRGAPDAPGRRVRGCVLLGRSRAGCLKAAFEVPESGRAQADPRPARRGPLPAGDWESTGTVGQHGLARDPGDLGQGRLPADLEHVAQELNGRQCRTIGWVPAERLRVLLLTT
jgi:hypothetical protein